MKNSSSIDKEVLAVEDEPSIGQVFLRVLSGEGFNVDTATTGGIALEMVQQKRHDYCLIDVKTPAMNGREFCMFLQKQPSTLGDQVIFATGDISFGETPRFLEESDRPFLPKPFTPDELIAKVRETWKETGP
ncbi:MAG: response regulator [Chloroflexi bacterium]|nr:response regulator [Chloroflexota bacterium]